MNIEDRLLTIGSSHGRSGKNLVPKGVVVHYVGNPGSSALANRNYFEDGSEGNCVSAHYIIGLSGEILRCIPENECAAHVGKSYAPAYDEMAKTNNSRLLGIECCHPDSNGKFNNDTMNSLIELLVDICKRYNFNIDTDVYRHYDVCGKMCPLYYVNNPAEWKKLKDNLSEELKKSASAAPPGAPNTDQKNNIATPPVESDNPKTSTPQIVEQPSGWAVEAWDWAKQNGITDGTRPTANTTREECVSFVYRLAKLLNK
jgi:N-acetylmuramoyl-L-alanine amidase